MATDDRSRPHATEKVHSVGKTRSPALLVLADGAIFEGQAIGASAVDDAIFTGEIVFNTAMSGYQEIITDPSYAGQVIAFTYPHIGNYGVNSQDYESRKPHCRAIVVRDLAVRPSNWRSESDLESFLIEHHVGGITGVDTRRLTRHIRESGSISCAIGTAPLEQLLAAARAEPGTEGVDLVEQVTTSQRYEVGNGPFKVVAYDFGIKSAILTQLGAIATVSVVPALTSPDEVLEEKPDGIFLSNGPGDPACLAHLVKTVVNLIGKVPIFGICLGHQLLATALGASTYKLAFGHHGANHPVRRLQTGQIEITSQNHNFAVDPAGLPRVKVSHVNLNDGVIEGFTCEDERAFGVQYHPEAGPGPHDARYLFEEFKTLMGTGR